MSLLQAPFYSASGEAKGQVELPDSIFSLEGSRRVLQEAIRALQANQRRGTSSTKTRGVVRGGGHKPWKQKGTGNARSGSIRSPLWRKGGIIFGPLPRSYRIDVDQSKKLIALQTALVEKAKAAEIGVLEALQFEQPKTKEAQQLLKKTGITGKSLLVLDHKDAKTARALANIPTIHIVDAAELNAWQLMASRKVFLTKAALDALEKRWPKGS